MIYSEHIPSFIFVFNSAIKGLNTLFHLILSFHFFPPGLWQLPMWCTDMFKSVHILKLQITECNALSTCFPWDFALAHEPQSSQGPFLPLNTKKRYCYEGKKKKKSKLLSYRQHKTQNTASYVMEWWSQLVWDSCQSKEFTENFSVVYTKFQTSSNLFSYLKDTLKEKPFSSNKTKL